MRKVTEIKAPVMVLLINYTSILQALCFGRTIVLQRSCLALDRLVVEAFVDPKDIAQIEPGRKKARKLNRV